VRPFPSSEFVRGNAPPPTPASSLDVFRRLPLASAIEADQAIHDRAELRLADVVLPDGRFVGLSMRHARLGRPASANLRVYDRAGRGERPDIDLRAEQAAELIGALQEFLRVTESGASHYARLAAHWTNKTLGEAG
jgi:hypothetical protein